MRVRFDDMRTQPPGGQRQDGRFVGLSRLGGPESHVRLPKGQEAGERPRSRFERRA